MFLLIYVEPMFPISKIFGWCNSILCVIRKLCFSTANDRFSYTDNKFLSESSTLSILFYIYLSTTCQRFKYYAAWKLGKAVTIMTGFGLIKNDLDEFEYISSVDILGFEVGTVDLTFLISMLIVLFSPVRQQLQKLPGSLEHHHAKLA